MYKVFLLILLIFMLSGCLTNNKDVSSLVDEVRSFKDSSLDSKIISLNFTDDTDRVIICGPYLLDKHINKLPIDEQSRKKIHYLVNNKEIYHIFAIRNDKIQQYKKFPPVEIYGGVMTGRGGDQLYLSKKGKKIKLSLTEKY